MIVVDTNLLAYRWLPSPRAAQADALAQLDPDWAAPLLWRSEFRHVLAGFIRSRKMTETEATRAVRHAAGLLYGGEFAVADEAVLALVAKSRCSAYDCEFVALAQALGVALITDDKMILQAFPKRCRSLDIAVAGGRKS